MSPVQHTSIHLVQFKDYYNFKFGMFLFKNRMTMNDTTTCKVKMSCHVRVSYVTPNQQFQTAYRSAALAIGYS